MNLVSPLGPQVTSVKEKDRSVLEALKQPLEKC